jgi:hypothetical protein
MRVMRRLLRMDASKMAISTPTLLAVIASSEGAPTSAGATTFWRAGLPGVSG